MAATAAGARLMVSDTGVGIPPEEMPHVFERFWRGARRPELRASGSGLGLSIVRSIVDMHEGAINIIVRTGRGHPCDRGPAAPRCRCRFFTRRSPGMNREGASSAPVPPPTDPSPRAPRGSAVRGEPHA